MSIIRSTFNNLKQYVYSYFDYSFDPKLLELSTIPLTIPELDRLMNDIYELFRDDHELIEQYRRLHDGSRFMIKRAERYDYNERIRANGFHTQCDFFFIMLQAIIVMKRQNTLVREHCFFIIKIFFTALDICRKLENDESLFSDKVTFVALINSAEELRNELRCIYTHYNSCWLYPCVSNIIRLSGIYMSIYFAHWTQFSIGNFFPSRQRYGELYTSFSLDSNIDCLKSMWNASEYKLVKLYLSRSIGYYYDIECRNVYASRQKRWRIATYEYETVYDTETEHNIGKTAMNYQDRVRCLMIRSKEARMRDRDILLHVHGGGFISQSPETHCYYLAEWVQNLNDLTILSIDYTLSPKGPFPEALQEVLDTYLWLTSNKPEVKEMLGFKPNKIILCGDSAGGNIAAALILVLSKIRQKLSTISGDAASARQFSMPCSLLLFYSPLVISTSSICPSRLIVPLDGLIPLAPILNCLRAYIPDDAFPEDTQTIRKNESFLTRLRNLFMPNCRCEPWFKQTERLEESMKILNDFLNNPFTSPLLCKDFEFSRTIKLYSFAAAYDPFLDDMIEFTKKWKGPKQIFVMPHVSHGFLNLVKVSEKSASTLPKILEFIVDSFQCSNLNTDIQ